MSARSARTNGGIAPRSDKSSDRNSIAPMPAAAAFSPAAVSSSVSLREMATTRYPAPASWVAIASPRPRLPPVTMMLRTRAHQLSGRGQLERGYEAQQAWNLVRRECAPAGVQKLVLDLIECL